MPTLTSLAILLFAYLIGSISSAILVCRLLRLPDPRQQGSGNPGATNVLRIGGKKPAAIVLFLDVIKGVVPILLGQYCQLSHTMLSWVMLAVFFGHLFPLFFQGKGGKGVATAFGALIAIAPVVGMCLFLTWLFVAAVSRYSSLAAIISTLMTPIYIILLGNTAYLPAVAILCIGLLSKHRSNIVRLYTGKESKIT